MVLPLIYLLFYYSNNQSNIWLALIGVMSLGLFLFICVIEWIKKVGASIYIKKLPKIQEEDISGWSE